MVDFDFKLIHLSDLHIHGGASPTNENHKHSIAHMKGIEKIVKRESNNMDRLIVTGDISHYGDMDNLLLAKQWIYNSLEIGNDIQISLGIKEGDFDKIKLIPGNHDAWNSNSTKLGNYFDRRQKSLSNFNYALRRNKKDVINFPDGYYYDWLEKDQRGVFFLFLDSSFLGDTEIENNNPKLTFFDQIAKGRISKKQSEKVLTLYDKGLVGNLEHPTENRKIDKDVFAKSLKIVVMHHYLFEPQGRTREPLLSVFDRDTVFRNFALSDIDILLCGHKHYAENKDHLYLHYLNKRARVRYLFNSFRRLVGIHSLPIQYETTNGTKMGKYLSAFISLFVKKIMSENDNKEIITDKVFMEKLADILLNAIENPDNLEREVKEYLKMNKATNVDDSKIDSGELIEIANRIKVNLSEEQKEKLKPAANELKKVIQNLFSRQFLQLMAGSACKANESKEGFRSFNIYKIKSHENGYAIRCERYVWNTSEKAFSDHPQYLTFEFQDRNRPLH